VPSQTGAYYSTPQVRYRPKYPELKHDDQVDRSATARQGKKTADRTMECSKFYADYVTKGLTGGLLVFWCTHGIACGFHCIPVGEGRNDVFSAIYTRWKKAPENILYDYACALAPYCMTREPDFFMNTRFFIDSFHAAGHKACSPASNIAHAREFDASLVDFNTSIAESRNAVLRRMTKSLSYMSQRRAIPYAKVFISLINRLRIRDLASQT
jgi:hypothetical protein